MLLVGQLQDELVGIAAGDSSNIVVQSLLKLISAFSSIFFVVNVSSLSWDLLALSGLLVRVSMIRRLAYQTMVPL